MAARATKVAEAPTNSQRAAWLLPVLALVVAAVLLAYTAPPLTDHPDTVRDLLAARDCADNGHCVAGGAQASFGHLRAGSLWTATLSAMRALGAPTEAAYWLVIGADALTVGLAAVLAGPLAAAALLGGLMLITREQLVWSPALMPLAAMLLASAWHTALGTQRHRDWALVGLAMAVQADLHPVGILFSGIALVLVGWTGKSAGRALATLIGAALAMLALAPEVALLNLSALHHRAPLLVSAAVVLTCTGAAWSHQRGRASNPDRAQVPIGVPDRFSAVVVPPFTLPAAAAMGASLCLLLASAFEVADLHPRYFLALLPPLALILRQIPLRRWELLAPALAPLAVAGLLGPAEIGVGHPWSVVQGLGQAIADDRQAWPSYLYRTQALGCRRLDGAVSVDLQAAAAAEQGRGSWQVVDLERDATPIGAGWRLVASWHQGRRPMQTWLRSFEPWVLRTEGEVCLASASGPHACQRLVPGLRLDQPTESASVAAALVATPWHLRTFPVAVALSPGRGPAQTTVKLAIRPTQPGRRTLRVVDLPERLCPWQITAILGVQANVAGDGLSATLTAQARSTGTVELTRSWGPGCDDLSEWQYGPPCLMEEEVAL